MCALQMSDPIPLKAVLSAMPIMAILRGLTRESVAEVGRGLYAAGIRFMEVPLNGEDALSALEELRVSLPDDVLVGAGTVLEGDQIDQVAQAGGQVIVSPHFDPALVARTKALGLISVPGVFTPSEAFAALKAGADGLKLFPADELSPAVLKAWRSVMAVEGVIILPTGGVSSGNAATWWAAGASGFGIGSGVFQPDLRGEAIEAHAARFTRAVGGLTR